MKLLTQAERFIAQIARMTQDGEGDFVMENDDAVETLNSLISDAREITNERATGAGDTI